MLRAVRHVAVGDRFFYVVDAGRLDAMLDDIMLYWPPNTGASSARLYWEGMQALMKGGMPQAPMPTLQGIAIQQQQQVQQQNNAMIQADLRQYERQQQKAQGIIDEAVNEFQPIQYELPDKSQLAETMLGKIAIINKKTAPDAATRVTTKSKNSAVFFPGRIPGMNAPFFCKFVAVASGSKLTAV